MIIMVAVLGTLRKGHETVIVQEAIRVLNPDKVRITRNALKSGGGRKCGRTHPLLFMLPKLKTQC